MGTGFTTAVHTSGRRSHARRALVCFLYLRWHHFEFYFTFCRFSSFVFHVVDEWCILLLSRWWGRENGRARGCAWSSKADDSSTTLARTFTHTHPSPYVFIFSYRSCRIFLWCVRVGVRIVSKSRRQWFARGGRLIDVAVRGGSVPSSVSHVWRKWDTGHAGRSHRRSQRLLDAW